ncbi:MAG: hypothetical protein IKU29_04050 [Parabacteroides sp.]|nr:hypothetical protein [Parabacteroides sp.]
MAMVLEIITIHLDWKNVNRLKEFKNYRENEMDHPQSCTYPPKKTYSKPKTINVVLSPLELPPIRTDHENVYAYKVSHEIEWGFNGSAPEVLMRQGRKYVYHSSYDNGMVWLTDREIQLLAANKDPGYFFNLFGEAEKNDN